MPFLQLVDQFLWPCHPFLVLNCCQSLNFLAGPWFHIQVQSHNLWDWCKLRSLAVARMSLCGLEVIISLTWSKLSWVLVECGLPGFFLSLKSLDSLYTFLTLYMVCLDTTNCLARAVGWSQASIGAAIFSLNFSIITFSVQEETQLLPLTTQNESNIFAGWLRHPPSLPSSWQWWQQTVSRWVKPQLGLQGLSSSLSTSSDSFSSCSSHTKLLISASTTQFDLEALLIIYLLHQAMPWR